MQALKVGPEVREVGSKCEVSKVRVVDPEVPVVQAAPEVVVAAQVVADLAVEAQELEAQVAADQVAADGEAIPPKRTRHSRLRSCRLMRTKTA